MSQIQHSRHDKLAILSPEKSQLEMHKSGIPSSEIIATKNKQGRTLNSNLGLFHDLKRPNPTSMRGSILSTPASTINSKILSRNYHSMIVL